MKTPEDIENEYNKARKELDTFDKEWEPLVLRCRALFEKKKKIKCIMEYSIRCLSWRSTKEKSFHQFVWS